MTDMTSCRRDFLKAQALAANGALACFGRFCQRVMVFALLADVGPSG